MGPPEHAPADKDERHVPDAPVPLPETCEALGCEHRQEGDDGFLYDTYGHAWCSRHAKRKHVLERGASLQTPFPMLFYARASRTLEEGQPSWEAFALTAPNDAIDEILRSIENRQARERLLKQQAEEDTA